MPHVRQLALPGRAAALFHNARPTSCAAHPHRELLPCLLAGCVAIYWLEGLSLVCSRGPARFRVGLAGLNGGWVGGWVAWEGSWPWCPCVCLCTATIYWGKNVALLLKRNIIVYPFSVFYLSNDSFVVPQMSMSTFRKSCRLAPRDTDRQTVL